MLMTRRVLVLLMATLAVTTLAYADHSWGPYHWARQSNPFTLKVHDNVTSNWEPYVAEAQADWNASTILDLNTLWQSPLSMPRKCSSAAGVIEICNLKYGQNGWLGIAGISISGSHITKGYTKLNDTYFNMAQYNTPAWRRMVTCQELAHDFGLDHQDETFNNANLGSCMDYTNDPDGGAGGFSSSDPSNEHPNAHDFEQIATIYAHVDSTTTVASLGGGLRAVADSLLVPVVTSFDDGNEPWEWGTPVGFDGHGRANKFRLELGNGEVRLTHVTWAPDVERGRSQEARD
jgi:hypothetical protein